MINPPKCFDYLPIGRKLVIEERAEHVHLLVKSRVLLLNLIHDIPVSVTTHTIQERQPQSRSLSASRSAKATGTSWATVKLKNWLETKLDQRIVEELSRVQPIIIPGRNVNGVFSWWWIDHQPIVEKFIVRKSFEEGQMPTVKGARLDARETAYNVWGSVGGAGFEFVWGIAWISSSSQSSSK